MSPRRPAASREGFEPVRDLPHVRAEMPTDPTAASGAPGAARLTSGGPVPLLDGLTSEQLSAGIIAYAAQEAAQVRRPVRLTIQDGKDSWTMAVRSSCIVQRITPQGTVGPTEGLSSRTGACRHCHHEQPLSATTCEHCAQPGPYDIVRHAPTAAVNADVRAGGAAGATAAAASATAALGEQGQADDAANEASPATAETSSDSPSGQTWFDSYATPTQGDPAEGWQPGDDIPFWPLIQVTVFASGAGSVVIDDETIDIKGADLPAAREQAFTHVRDEAIRLDRPVRVDAADPEGFSRLIVPPQGPITEEPEGTAATATQTAPTIAAPASLVEPPLTRVLPRQPRDRRRTDRVAALGGAALLAAAAVAAVAVTTDTDLTNPLSLPSDLSSNSTAVPTPTPTPTVAPSQAPEESGGSSAGGSTRASGAASSAAPSTPSQASSATPTSAASTPSEQAPTSAPTQPGALASSTAPSAAPSAAPSSAPTASTGDERREPSPSASTDAEQDEPRRSTSPSPAADGSITVAAGDSLSAIADQVGESVAALVEANDLGSADQIEAGQRLVVAGPAMQEAAEQADEQEAQPRTTPAPAQQDAPRVERQREEPRAAEVTPAADGSITVAAGETLGAIADQVGASVAALVAANDLPSADTITAGQKLVVAGPALRAATEAEPTPQSPPAAADDAPDDVPAAGDLPQQQAAGAEVTVERGDTLTEIAERTRTTIEQLTQLNALASPDLILAGQTLVTAPPATDAPTAADGEGETAPEDQPVAGEPVASTAEPSAGPSAEPTEEPTNEPSAEPTATPSAGLPGLPVLPGLPGLPVLPGLPDLGGLVPGTSPSAEPSAEPSAGPSAEPTEAPTAEPSAEPTATPSAGPSAGLPGLPGLPVLPGLPDLGGLVPGTSPSAEPSAEPSAAPTATPSAGPTATPSPEPSATSTTEPSAGVSVSPTSEPPQPTPTWAEPISVPTALEELVPTAAPTAEPIAPSPVWAEPGAVDLTPEPTATTAAPTVELPAPSELWPMPAPTSSAADTDRAAEPASTPTSPSLPSTTTSAHAAPSPTAAEPSSAPDRVAEPTQNASTAPTQQPSATSSVESTVEPSATSSDEPSPAKVATEAMSQVPLLPSEAPAAALMAPLLLGAGLTGRKRPSTEQPAGEGDAALPPMHVTASTRAESPVEQVTLADLRPGGALAGHTGALDVVLGAIGTQETWQMAADSACDSRWSLALQRLAALRAGKGVTYLRFAPEMNGDWQPWSVTPAERAHFVVAWQRWRELQRAHFPAARVVFCTAHRSTQDYDWTTLLPGVGQLDVLGVAFHPTDLPRTTTDAQRVLHEVDVHGAPVGPEAHRAAAQGLGVALAIAEWTNVSESGPSPVLRQAMTDLTRTYRGRGAGQVLYDLELTFPV